MISIKTGCCLKASSCQAELPLRHRHHNRGCPSHNSVWLAQGENGSLRRVRPAAGWQVCICEARRTVYLLSFCLLNVSVFSARKATRTKWHGEYSPWCEEANTCLYSISPSHIHTYMQKHTDTHGDILSDDTVFLLNAWITTFTLRYSNLNTITGLLSVCCCYQHFTEGTHSHVAVSVVRKWKKKMKAMHFDVFIYYPSIWGRSNSHLYWTTILKPFGKSAYWVFLPRVRHHPHVFSPSMELKLRGNKLSLA